MRDIAFELAAPAGELRRQRGSGSHKVSPDAGMTGLLTVLSKRVAFSVKAGHGMTFYDKPLLLRHQPSRTGTL